jgi:type II secretory pathway pseudopilin PulG
MTTEAAATNTRDRASERGMSLLVLMGMMAVFAIMMLAVAPSIQQQVQREKELAAIQRGEEVAEAIRQYVEFYRGSRLPQSMDDLLDGLPQGTKKRQILRAEAAVDPLSTDGKWRLIKADPQILGKFARRVQNFNNGVLPPNPSRTFDRYGILIVNNINADSGDAATDDDDDDLDFEVDTDNTPFIGVASQDTGKSVIAYYGIERHSSWIFTPLFRGNGNPTVPQTTIRPAVVSIP